MEWVPTVRTGMPCGSGCLVFQVLGFPPSVPTGRGATAAAADDDDDRENQGTFRNGRGGLANDDWRRCVCEVYGSRNAHGRPPQPLARNDDVGCRRQACLKCQAFRRRQEEEEASPAKKIMRRARRSRT
jgi:hypothetical protein